jgi:hypothetical protein
MSSLVADCFGSEAGSDGCEYECGCGWCFSAAGAGAGAGKACFPDWDAVGSGIATEAVRVCWALGAAAKPEPEPESECIVGLSFRSCRTRAVDRTVPPMAPRVANNPLHSHSNSPPPPLPPHSVSGSGAWYNAEAKQTMIEIIREGGDVIGNGVIVGGMGIEAGVEVGTGTGSAGGVLEPARAPGARPVVGVISVECCAWTTVICGLTLHLRGTYVVIC